MLDVTSDDIAKLKDDDLRTLVGLLCEAELGRQGLPRSAVTWGGSQDAGDGGIDVRVDLKSGPLVSDFIPRLQTGFQVKKPDLPPAKIEEEMAPKDSQKVPVIRECLLELGTNNGSYVIVSSTASLTDSALKKRRATMAKVADLHLKGGSLQTDFYDRSRIATWIRDYPGILAWVREKSGRSIQGWRSYGSWTRGGDLGDYLFDDQRRIVIPGSRHRQLSTVTEAIHALRVLLDTPRTVVRLIGLSGVGKTRLAEALFDSKLGQDALQANLVLYTDTAFSPSPAPAHMAEGLVDDERRAILIVDNCPSNLHSILAAAASRSKSSLSVMTIEYDIQEEAAEGTDVFQMLPASESLTTKLLKERFADKSPTDLERIASQSGGNSRLALAIAGSLGKNQSTTGLTDDDIFQRLFWQKRAYDPQEEHAAQVCSLVYSFDAEAQDEATGEMSKLAALTELSLRNLFGQLAKMKQKDILQSRGRWRAVLPHVIANRLAKQALRLIPARFILEGLVAQEPDRLAVSFSRRIGYLHDAPEAIAIVADWLAPGGLLDSVQSKSEHHLAMFVNVAPVSPKLWLESVERIAGGNEAFLLGSSGILDALRLIAFEAVFFQRAANLLIHLHVSEASGSRMEAGDYLCSLFQLYSSGTHATAEQRADVIETLLMSSDPYRQGVGVMLLGVLLDAGTSIRYFALDFGTRERDHGNEPRTSEMVGLWFTKAIGLLEKMASVEELSVRLKSLLAEKFRNLWDYGNCHDVLERACLTFQSQKFWHEGLSEVRKTLHYDGQEMSPKFRERLENLANQLEPVRLADKVRKTLFSTERDWDNNGNPKVDLKLSAFSFGEQIGQNPQALRELLPDVVCNRVSRHFGEGLASTVASPEELWKELTFHFAQTTERQRQPLVLAGFLYRWAADEPSSVENILENALTDPVLGPFFLELQTALPVSETAVMRVVATIGANLVPLDSYRNVHWWDKDTSGGISEADYARIVSKLAESESGLEAALELFCWRFKIQATATTETILLELGRDILGKLKVEDIDEGIGHLLKRVADHCLKDASTEVVARHLCKQIRIAIASTSSIFHSLAEPLASVAAFHPYALLDEFILGPEREFQRVYIGFRSIHERPTCFDIIPDTVVLDWAGHDPEERYLRLTTVARMLYRPANDRPLEWTSLALAILEQAPRKPEVLAVYARLVIPIGWNGSKADKMTHRLYLFDALSANSPLLSDLVMERKAWFQAEIDRQRNSEQQEQRGRHERFE